MCRSYSRSFPCFCLLISCVSVHKISSQTETNAIHAMHCPILRRSRFKQDLWFLYLNKLGLLTSTVIFFFMCCCCCLCFSMAFFRIAACWCSIFSLVILYSRANSDTVLQNVCTLRSLQPIAGMPSQRRSFRYLSSTAKIYYKLYFIVTKTKGRLLQRSHQLKDTEQRRLNAINHRYPSTGVTLSLNQESEIQRDLSCLLITLVLPA